MRGAVPGAPSRRPQLVDRSIGVPAAPSGLGVRLADRLVRHLVEEKAVAPSGLTMAGLHRGRVLVTDDGAGVAGLLAEQLRAQGVAAQVIALDPPEDLSDVAGMVFLGGLREVTGPDEAVAVNREAFAAARAVAPRFSREGGVFVTVQDTGGDFGLHGRQGDRAWLGGLAALARTVAKEWPDAAVKAIDCERAGRTPAQLAVAIAEELLSGGTVLDVGLRSDGRRMTQVVKPESVPMPVDRWGADSPLIGPDSVIVATGGGRGITAAALLAIAEAYRPRLVLIGRTALAAEPPALHAADDETALRGAIVANRRREGAPIPPPAEIGAMARRIIAIREVRRTIADLTRAGSSVRYLPVDVRDTAALGQALAQVRRDWGPVTGVIHGAGVLADKPVDGKTQEMFDRVFDVKVQGLRSLLDATAADPLSFIYLISSVAAQFGNAGQSDYAMANEVLFQVAAAQTAHRPDRPVTAVGWGPWNAGMVTRELAGHFRADGVALVPADQGGQAILASLGAAPIGRRLLIAADGDKLLPARVRRRTAELRVDLDSRPELTDHAIGGTAVVPLAFTLDWLTAAARELDPAARQVTLADLRVFQRITVEPGRTRQLTLAIEEVEHATELKLLEERGRPCQSARLTSVVSGQKFTDWSPPSELRPLRHANPYDSDALFHGPRFRSLHAVDGVSVDGATGTVVGTRRLGWPERYRHLDPCAVDGALQLGVLWAEHIVDAPTLPMGVRFVRSSMNGSLSASARCVVRSRRVSPDQISCDIALLGPEGRPLLELLGVTLIRRP
ncbi:SDR family oxidoreductase [Nocardia goodfellowii]